MGNENNMEKKVFKSGTMSDEEIQAVDNERKEIAKAVRGGVKPVKVKASEKEDNNAPADEEQAGAAPAEQAVHEAEANVVVQDPAGPLKPGTEVIWARETPGGNTETHVYKVISHKGKGGFANGYIVEHNKKLMFLKEFCPNGAKRLKNNRLLFDIENKDLDDFKKEPGRILEIFEKGKGKIIFTEENLTLSDARKQARDKMPGCVFEWHGTTMSSYTEAEIKNFNLIIPQTPWFQDSKNQNYYYVMDLADGCNLAEWMSDESKRKNWTLDTLFLIMKEVAIAVQNMHNTFRFAHLDLSPNNIMVDVIEDGKKVKVTVIDFGLATNMAELEKNIKGIIGSWRPGGTDGFNDAAVNLAKYIKQPAAVKLIDIYSMGTVFLYMLYAYFNAFDSSNSLSKDKEYEIQDWLKNDILDIWHNEKEPERIFGLLLGLEDTPNYEKVKSSIELIKIATAYIKDEKETDPFQNRIQSPEDFIKGIDKFLYEVKWDGKNELTLDAAQKKADLRIHATGPWKAKVYTDNNDGGWITLSKDKGKAGKWSLDFIIVKNPNTTPRTAEVVVTSGYKTIKAQIVQEGGEKQAPTISFPENASRLTTFTHDDKKTGKLTIIATDVWTALVNPGGKDQWIHIDGLPGGKEGCRDVTFHVDPNTGEERKGEIIFTCGETKRTWYVTQYKQPVPLTKEPEKPVQEPEQVPLQEPVKKPETKPAAQPKKPVVVLPPADYIRPLTGKTLTFDVESGQRQSVVFNCNKPWEANVVGGSWLKVSPIKGAEKDAQFTVETTERNSTDKQRSAMIKVTAGQADMVYTVIQKPADFLEIPKNLNATVPWEGGEMQLKFRCTADWKLGKLPQPDSNFRFWETSGKAGDNVVNILIKENPNHAPVDRELKVICDDSSFTCHIRQKAKPKKPTPMKSWLTELLCMVVVGVVVYFLLPPPPPTTLEVPLGQYYEIPHEGGQTPVEVVCNDVWKAEVVEEAPEGWLQIKNESEDGNGIFQVSGGINKGYEPKKATVKVYSGDLSKLVHVTQGIDRPDSLERQIERMAVDKGMRRTFIHKNMAPTFDIYEYDAETGQKNRVDGDIYEIIAGNKSGLEVGKTHDLIAFEEETVDGEVRIKSITLLKRK